MSPLYHINLIGKVLGEAVPIKSIMAKCWVEWEDAKEVSFINMGNGVSLAKFTNEVDCNKVLMVNLGLLEVKFIVYKIEKKILTILKRSCFLLYFGMGFLVSLWGLDRI